MAKNDENVKAEDTVQTPKISHSEAPKAVKTTLQYFEKQGASVMNSLFLGHLHDEAAKSRSQYGRQQDITRFFKKRLEPIDENSACVEVGITFDLRRGVNSNNFNYITSEEVRSVKAKFSSIIGYIVRASNKELEKKKDGTVESTDTIAKLKTKIENSSTFESDPDFVKTLIQNCIDERVSQNEREETATHIGIRETEDWFRPIDLAKECDIYISSRSGSHKEIPITYGYTQDPFKNRSQNFKPKIKENYPQYLERENKIALYAVIHLITQETVRSVLKPKESNDHIHNRINVNTLKVESENKIAMNLQIFNIVNIVGLRCSGKSSSPGSGNGGKREIVLNRRPELYRGKYRCVQPKINLLKRRSYACETMFSLWNLPDVEEMPSHDGETV
ncbi:hypothetical protein TNCV_863821 [Trichonephila clavipes]|nr:hypothetical protein TNCV_863821 [Trichonephila clavipes]